MPSDSNRGTVAKQERQHGRTLLKLTNDSTKEWTATQHGVAVEGTGGTAALAAMDYCRKIAEGQHG